RRVAGLGQAVARARRLLADRRDLRRAELIELGLRGLRALCDLLCKLVPHLARGLCRLLFGLINCLLRVVEGLLDGLALLVGVLMDGAVGLGLVLADLIRSI